ncbi:MAG: N-formylglutamate amidohydrolase [Fibrobacter sp.]|nr:N-formylglutamate amidohydrolase [Fibrobacter sp.]
MKNSPALMITCEHASNALPDFVLRAFREYNVLEAKRLGKESSNLFGIPEEVLASHRGYDIGAYIVYSNLVKRLKPDFNCLSTYSRLVIDMNRSLTNKKLFSEFTIKLPKHVKAHITKLWQKYRGKIDRFVSSKIPENMRDNQEQKPIKVIHLGIHSFTPVLNGVEREADVGILYDPSRPAEAALAETLIKSIHEFYPQLSIRRNYPYLGKSDGLTTTLRQKFGTAYVGLEIEINQKLLDF